MLALLLAATLATSPQATPKPADNALCPVTGEKLTARKAPRVIVRGRTYKVCCRKCIAHLRKNPDKYLKPDGTPRNAKP